MHCYHKNFLSQIFPDILRDKEQNTSVHLYNIRCADPFSFLQKYANKTVSFLTINNFLCFKCF